MNKGQSGQRDRPGTEQQGKPRQGKQKGTSGGQRGLQRDQLDDQGVQHHMGHGDQKDAQRRRRPIEGGDQSEERGRPAGVGQGDQRRGEDDRTEQGREWEDKTEGTSRQLERSW